MKVQFRTGGGRGEYEVAGVKGTLTARDLIEYDLQVDLGSWGIKITDVYVDDDGAKTRLRRRRRIAPQLPRQVAAALLMPQPARVRHIVGGPSVLSAGAYTLKSLDCDSVILDNRDTSATLRFGTCTVANALYEVAFNVPLRLERVRAIHARAADYVSPLGDLLRDHATMVSDAGPYPEALEFIVRDIMREVEEQATAFAAAYFAGLDVLPVLESMLAPIALLEPADLIAIESPEIRIRETRFYRMAAARGPAANKLMGNAQTSG